jgi:hypothetical protein
VSQGRLHVYISLRSQCGGHPALRPSASRRGSERSRYSSSSRVPAGFLRHCAMGESNGRPPRQSDARRNAESSEGIALIYAAQEDLQIAGFAPLQSRRVGSVILSASRSILRSARLHLSASQAPNNRARLTRIDIFKEGKQARLKISSAMATPTACGTTYAHSPDRRIILLCFWVRIAGCSETNANSHCAVHRMTHFLFDTRNLSYPPRRIGILQPLV